MNTRGRCWWPPCAMWTTLSCSANPTLKPCSKICAQTFTPKARITPRKPSPNAPRPTGLVFAWPLSAIPRIIPRADCSMPFARGRMAEQRFLVVRLGSLGDIVHTFPAVAGLRESFPNAGIAWVTHPRWVDLVSSSNLAHEIWPMDSRKAASVRQTVSRIRALRWKAAIDYQGLWKSALLPFLGGVSPRIGFSSETIREYGVPILYSKRVRTQSAHVADQNGELTLAAGAANPVGRVSLNVSQEEIAR